MRPTATKHRRSNHNRPQIATSSHQIPPIQPHQTANCDQQPPNTADPATPDRKLRPAAIKYRRSSHTRPQIATSSHQIPPIQPHQTANCAWHITNITGLPILNHIPRHKSPSMSPNIRSAGLSDTNRTQNPRTVGYSDTDPHIGSTSTDIPRHF